MSIWIKVLVGGAACHGGGHDYDLPKYDSSSRKWIPGAWTPHVTDPINCSRGYHLTQKPASWFKQNCQLFVAEGKGAHDNHDPNKTAWSSVRLLRPVNPIEWKAQLSMTRPTPAQTALWRQDPTLKVVVRRLEREAKAAAAKAKRQAQRENAKYRKKVQARRLRERVRIQRQRVATKRSYIRWNFSKLAQAARRCHIVIPRLAERKAAALAAIK
jgi:hypothetical protein